MGLAALAVAACSSVPTDDSFLGLIRPYRMEVVQGNVVTSEMVAELRPGMVRDQVRALLGSPLLNDVFHANRWDYVFSIRRQGTPPQQRRVTVFFDGERVQRFDADALPSEREFVASIDVKRPARKPPTLELTEAQLRALPQPVVRAAAPAAEAASGPQRAYPPLEPVSQ